MALRLERRELLAAKLRASARHHHGGIPPQHGSRGAKRMQASEFLLELLIRGQRHFVAVLANRGGHSTDGSPGTRLRAWCSPVLRPGERKNIPTTSYRRTTPSR